MASASDICHGCKSYKEIVYREEGTNRPFCQGCALALPPASEELAQMFLNLTVPFRIGQKVIAKQVVSCDGEAIEFRTEGTGEVLEISTDLRHGGTPVYPTFRVRIDDKKHEQAPDEAWFTEVCLERVKS